jgi:membrane fusion protein (multidrug efflux system)
MSPVRTSPSALFLPAFAALALALAGCSAGESAPPAPPPPQVGFITIGTTAVANAVELPARIAPVRSAEVRARVDGIVEQRLFTEGADVGRGTPLFRIDARPLRASLDVQTAAVRRAQAEAANAQREVARYRPLVAVEAISRQEFEAAQARLAQAQAQVQSAQAQVRQAQLTLGYTTVTSPIAGRVGRAEVTEGALASQATGTLLTRVDQLDPIYVNFALPSEQLLALRRNAKAGGIAQAATLILADASPYSEAGAINFLDQAVDPGTGTVSLRAVFKNPQRLLLPGDFVRVRIEAGVDPNAITVPQSAVQLSGTSANVMVVGKNNLAEPRPVKLGRMIGPSWVITEGLRPGDRVIVSGIQAVRPGAPVKPVPAAQSAKARAKAPAYAR